MPGLLRGIARTAVVAGTASAVSGRVQRRQAEKYTERDAQIYADRQAAYSAQTAPAPQPQAGPFFVDLDLERKRDGNRGRPRRHQ